MVLLPAKYRTVFITVIRMVPRPVLSFERYLEATHVAYVKSQMARPVDAYILHATRTRN